MRLLDKHNQIEVRRVIDPVVATDDTALVGQIIDTAGLEAVELSIALGTLVDSNATFTAKLEEGAAADLSDAADVADGDMIGTEAGASFTFADDNETRKLGYVGTKRYIRLTITPSGNTGDAPISAVALCFPKVQPAA